MVRNLFPWAALAFSLPFAQAQTNELLAAKPAPIAAKAGSLAEARLSLDVRPGFHVQSNTPSDPYLIPLKLTWNPGPLSVSEVVYPKPQMEKYGFSPTPLSVFSGNFEVVTKFKVPSSAQLGPIPITGKLRYQACNDRECKSPKTIDVALQVIVVK